MFEYFYNEILRKTVVSFGSLFNNIVIKHKDQSDNVIDQLKVPLAYGPIQKFLARLEQTPDLNTSVQIFSFSKFYLLIFNFFLLS